MASTGLALAVALGVLLWPRPPPPGPSPVPSPIPSPGQLACLAATKRLEAFDRLVDTAPRAGHPAAQRELALRMRDLVVQYAQQPPPTEACGERRAIPIGELDATMEGLARDLAAAGDDRAAAEVRAWAGEAHALLERR